MTQAPRRHLTIIRNQIMKKTIICNLSRVVISAKKITEQKNPVRTRKTSLRSGRSTSSRSGLSRTPTNHTWKRSTEESYKRKRTWTKDKFQTGSWMSEREYGNPSWWRIRIKVSWLITVYNFDII